MFENLEKSTIIALRGIPVYESSKEGVCADSLYKKENCMIYDKLQVFRKKFLLEGCGVDKVSDNAHFIFEIGDEVSKGMFALDQLENVCKSYRYQGRICTIGTKEGA